MNPMNDDENGWFNVDPKDVDAVVEIASEQSTMTFWFYAPADRVAGLIDELADEGFVLELTKPALEPMEVDETLLIVAGTSSWLARHGDLERLAAAHGASYDGWETGVIVGEP